MSCNCNRSGKTYVNFVASNGGSTTKIIDLTHYLCNCRKLCVNGSMTPTATISYAVKDIVNVGNGAYALIMSLTGTLTYLPVRSSNCCCASECDCPVVESFYADVTTDYTSATAPTSITGGNVVVSPITTCCGAGISSAVDIITSVTITAPTAG